MSLILQAPFTAADKKRRLLTYRLLRLIGVRQHNMPPWTWMRRHRDQQNQSPPPPIPPHAHTTCSPCHSHTTLALPRHPLIPIPPNYIADLAFNSRAGVQSQQCMWEGA